METKEVVSNALVELGTTPQEIADKLRAMGIKGRRVDGSACPIARYLRKLLQTDSINIGYRTYLCVKTGLDDFMPVPISLFIEAFDAGRFPELLCPGATPHPIN